MDLAAFPLFLITHVTEVRAAIWHSTLWLYWRLERLA